MAGAGYKLFQTGDVLTAAQVNTYLNEQTVMVFASSAARTSALSGVLAEGMMSYLQDTNAVEVYNGTAWTAVGGGGLSSPLTTKGDVWGYSTTNARIPVGSNGTVLTADSAETLGVKWATPASGGMTLLSTTTLSGTTTTISSIDQTYVHLYILIYGMTASGNFPAEVRPNAGANFSGVRMIGTSTSTVVNRSNDTWINLNYNDNASSGGNNAHIILIHNYASTTNYKPITGAGHWETPSTTDRQQFGGVLNTNSAITSIDVNTGNAATFSGGTVKIYGVK